MAKILKTKINEYYITASEDSLISQIKVFTIFRKGCWIDGTCRNMIWYDGVWCNGHFNGYYSYQGVSSQSVWFDGIWLTGTWEGDGWLNGTWEKGHIMNFSKNYASDREFNRSRISPKAFHKPNNTISLNYSKYI